MTPLHRYIGNPILTWMINVIFGTHFSDTHSGFRAITREALDRSTIKTGGMEFASEMLVLASKEHLKIVEVPIDYYPRIYSFKTSQFCRWLAAYPVCPSHETPSLRGSTRAIIFAVVGILLMAFFYLQGNVESSHLHTFILGAILMMGGLQVVLTGFLMKTYSVIHGYEKKPGSLNGSCATITWKNSFWSARSWCFSGFFSVLTSLSGGSARTLVSSPRSQTAIISLVLIITGLQVFLFAVFQSMMLLNENNGHG